MNTQRHSQRGKGGPAAVFLAGLLFLACGTWVGSPKTRPTTTPPATIPPDKAGTVTAQADPNNIGVTGLLTPTTSLVLDANAIDTVLAFSLVGNMPSTDLGTVIKATVKADGTFSIKLPQNAGAAGGQAWVLVTMASHPELTGMAQLVAEAEGFQFIQLPIGKEGLLALPTAAAKGDLGLGQITTNGDDATAALPADSTAFTTDQGVLDQLARTEKSLKFIRNIWMNTNATTAEAYQAAPYFSWASLAAKSTNAWEAPTDPTYSGYGVGFSDQGGRGGATPTIGLSDVCDKTTGNFVLTPPAPLIPVDSTGKALPPVTSLDNSDSTAAQSDASDGGNASRMACNSASTGFYAHSETGLTGWNWGGDGYSGKVADGIWTLALNEGTIANFDLASGTPLDANGNPVVYIPVLNVTSNTSGLISQVQVKLFRYDTTANAYAEVTDLTAFKELINNSSISIGLGSGSTTEGAMYSPNESIGTNVPLTLTGNVFSVAASAFTHAWMIPGATSGAGQIAAESIVIQYQMYGNTYRFVHRVVFGQ